MTLNMAVRPGQEILAGLIAQADVLVENFSVGTLEKWGFSDEWLEDAHAARRSAARSPATARRGPKAGLPGYDFILQAESGLMSICGEPDGEPMKYGVAIVDICTGMLASNAILAALKARHHTGQGAARRSVALRFEPRDAGQRRVQLPRVGPRRAAGSATAIRTSCRTPPIRSRTP